MAGQMPVDVVSGGWGKCRLAQNGDGLPPPSTTSLPFFIVLFFDIAAAGPPRLPPSSCALQTSCEGFPVMTRPHSWASWGCTLSSAPPSPPTPHRPPPHAWQIWHCSGGPANRSIGKAPSFGSGHLLKSSCHSGPRSPPRPCGRQRPASTRHSRIPTTTSE